MTVAPSGRVSAPPGPQVALALGGGSARGLAHIVMLEAFDELGIKPVIIAGTSMGSICGACYAAGLSAAEIRAGFESQFTSAATFFKQFAGKLRGGISTLWSVRSPGIVDNVTLFEMLLPEVLHSDFDSLKIPFLDIAADFYAI
jgi:NTE family protein